MKTHPVFRTIVAAMVAVSLAGSGSAWADRKNDQRSYGHSQGGHHDKRAYGRSQGGHYNKHYSYNKHRKNRYKRHYYKGNHRYPYYRGYGGNYYRYDDDNSDEKLLIGLLVGGLVGYAINSAQQDDPYRYDSYPQAHTLREAQPIIYEADRSSAATCLQEREYQMKVIVGGRTVDAYGTACLQPDGSWSRGPAKLVSY